MRDENAIEVSNVIKLFRVYIDKGFTLKEKLLFRNRRRYEVRNVLNDVSFEVKKGEAFALIGENGCGKSTTLKLLTRIMYPDSGNIAMRGRVSSLIELGAGFHPDMNGRQNIYMNAAIFGLTKKEIDERIEGIIDFSELREFIDNPVRTYSSGMYMRLAFSIAINVDADILLIDEILAVGDAGFQTKCFDKLQEIRNSGVTIVLVSHDMGTVERFCDRAAWLSDGRLAAIGRSAETVDRYLQYVDAKRVKTLEKDRSVANREPAPPSVPSNDSNRFGLQTAVIRNAWIRDEKACETSTLTAGQNYVLDIEYEKKEGAPGCVFGFGIYTVNGVCLYGSDTRLDRVSSAGRADRGHVRCEFPDVQLMTGEYILQVSIVAEDGTPLDCYRDYSHFDVVSGDRGVGAIHMNHRWIES